eukprot:g1471.t1
MSKYKVDLREREKELNCLYEVSELIASTDLTLDECLQRIADVLPKSWLHASEAVAEVRVGERAFTTAGWTAGLTNAIVAEVATSESNSKGSITVAYADVEKEFLEEEHSLIKEVARKVARMLQQRRTTADLSERMKEISCDFGVSQALSSVGDAVSPVFEMIAKEIVPKGWQFPERTGCSIEFIGVKDIAMMTTMAELVAKSPFSTADTYDTHTLAEDIRLDEQAVLGRITVSAGYSFLPQERELLRAVAGHISIFISRRHDQELLRERCKELKLLHDLSEMSFASQSPESFLAKVRERLPAAMQHPKACVCSIDLHHGMWTIHECSA